MPNDIDILMARVAEINAERDPTRHTPQDAAVLIAYHRHNRARRATGYRPAKPEKPKVDVLGLLNLAAPPPKPKTTTTPSNGGVRRL